MRKITLPIVGALAVALVVSLWIVLASADSGVYSVEVNNRNGFASATTTGGAIVEYIGDSNTTFGASGTGLFDSFLRVQHDATENGYNTNGTLEFNTKAGNWTHAILVSQIPVITVGGNQYWELFADINETNNAKHISLDDLEVYFTTNQNLTGYSFGLTPVYDFGGTIKINDVNQGSGRGDLRYLVPLSSISIPAGCNYGSATCGTYFLLYTKWGGTGTDQYASDGGFEEWKVKIYLTSTTTSAQDWLPNDSATVTWAGGSTLSGSIAFTLYDGPDCGVTKSDGTPGTVVLRSTETVAFTDLASPVTRSTSNSTVKVTSSTTVSWKVVFTPSGGGVLGSQHCETSALTITN